MDEYSGSTPIVTPSYDKNRPINLYSEGLVSKHNFIQSSVGNMKPVIEVSKNNALAVNIQKIESNKVLENRNEPDQKPLKTPPPSLLNGVPKVNSIKNPSVPSESPLKESSIKSNPFDAPKSPFHEAVFNNESKSKGPRIQKNPVSGTLSQAPPSILQTNPAPSSQSPPFILKTNYAMPSKPSQVSHPVIGLSTNTPPDLSAYKLPKEKQASSPELPALPNNPTKLLIDQKINTVTQGISSEPKPLKKTEIIKLNQAIPTNNPPIQIVKKKQTSLIISDIYNTLVPFIDHDKLFTYHAEILKESEKLPVYFEEAKYFIDLVSKETTCCICVEKNIKTLKLNCDHCICSQCLTTSIQTSFKFKKMECPACKVQIKDSEELRIFEFCGKSKKEMKKAEILEGLQNSSVKCEICEKFKKNFFVNSCLHACQECQASLIRRYQSVCPICKESWDVNSLKSVTFNCSNCKQNNPFIDGFGKYLHGENCLLCLTCTHSSLINRSCSKCFRKLKRIEKCELNDHLFTICAWCATEEFRGYTTTSSCCQKTICNQCSQSPECHSCPNN